MKALFWITLVCWVLIALVLGFATSKDLMPLWLAIVFFSIGSLYEWGLYLLFWWKDRREGRKYW